MKCSSTFSDYKSGKIDSNNSTTKQDLNYGHNINKFYQNTTTRHDKMEGNHPDHDTYLGNIESLATKENIGNSQTENNMKLATDQEVKLSNSTTLNSFYKTKNNIRMNGGVPNAKFVNCTMNARSNTMDLPTGLDFAMDTGTIKTSHLTTTNNDATANSTNGNMNENIDLNTDYPHDSDSVHHSNDEFDQYLPSEEDDNEEQYSPTESTDLLGDRRKNLSRNDISEVLQMGYTQEKAAQHFNMSLSTFKRRLIYLNFKWPRGKRQRETLGVANFDSKRKKLSKSQNISIHQENNYTSNIISIEEISKNNNPISLNNRLEYVIQQCQSIIRENNEEQRYEERYTSADAVDTISKVNGVDTSLIATNLFDTTNPAILYRQLEMLMEQNFHLSQTIIRNRQQIIEMKHQLFQYIPQSLSTHYIGDIQNLTGPWNMQKDPLVGISIVDRRFRLIASNKAWRIIMGYDHHELSIPEGFSTFHNLWPYFSNFEEVLTSIHNLYKLTKLRQAKSQGIYRRKNGDYILVEYICHFIGPYLWEEIRLVPNTTKEIVFEMEEGEIKKPRTSVLDKPIAEASYANISSEAMKTFYDVLDLAEYVNHSNDITLD